MPTGPGGGGSSSFFRESELKSSIDPAQRLVAGEREHDRPELRPALGAREREPKRAQVAADRLELAQDLLRRQRREVAVRALAQLAEARQRGRGRPGPGPPR